SSSYSFSWDGKPDESETIKFDWAAKSAAMDQAGKKSKAKLSADSVDVQLVQLLVAADAAAGKLPDSYHVVDKGDDTTYTVKSLPDAKLRLQSGNYQTKVVTLTNAAKKRTITAWLAPNLHYLPVQVQQVDKNTVTLTLLHITYSDEAAPAAGTK